MHRRQVTLSTVTCCWVVKCCSLTCCSAWARPLLFRRSCSNCDDTIAQQVVGGRLLLCERSTRLSRQPPLQHVAERYSSPLNALRSMVRSMDPSIAGFQGSPMVFASAS